jgi:hypothetical protein
MTLYAYYSNNKYIHVEYKTNEIGNIDLLQDLAVGEDSTGLKINTKDLVTFLLIHTFELHEKHNNFACLLFEDAAYNSNSQRSECF